MTLIVTAALVALVAVWVCAVYPSFRDSFADVELPEFYEGFLGEAGSITSPEGFITAEWFSWMPALIAAVAIALGTAAIAGDERDGTLEITLAAPISRTRILVDKTLALAAGVLLATATAFPAFLLAMPLGDISIPASRIAGALALTGLLTLNFLALALWLSALMPTRRLAAIVATGVLVISYFVTALGASVPALDRWKAATPLYWADASLPLTGSVDWWRVAALIAGPVVLWILARDAFQRREIGSGRLAIPRREGRSTGPAARNVSPTTRRRHAGG